MGRIKRLIFIESGLMDYTDIPVDGHCGIFGPSSSGKTSILRVLLSPVMTGKKELGIGGEQRPFQNFYFQDAGGSDLNNAYIVFDMVNDFGAPFTVVLRKDKGDIYSEYIRAPYVSDWFFGEDGFALDWGEAKLNIGSLWAESVKGMKAFNERMCGIVYRPEFSYLHFKNKNNAAVFTSLLSSIIRNREGSTYSDTVREALVLAHLARLRSDMGDVDREVDNGINLKSYVDGLNNFQTYVEDIRLMSSYEKGGDNGFSLLVDSLFDACDKLDQYVLDKSSIPGRVRYAFRMQTKEISDIQNDLSIRKTEFEETDKLKVSDIRELEDKNRDKNAVLAEQNALIKLINERQSKYDSLPPDVTFQNLLDWSAKKSEISLEYDTAKTEKSALMGPADQLMLACNDEKEVLRQSYSEKLSAFHSGYAALSERIDTHFKDKMAASKQTLARCFKYLDKVVPEDFAERMKTGGVHSAVIGEGRAASRLSALVPGGASMPEVLTHELERLSEGLSEGDWSGRLEEELDKMVREVSNVRTSISSLVGSAKGTHGNISKLEERRGNVLKWLKKREQDEADVINNRLKSGLDKIEKRYEVMIKDKLGDKKLEQIKQCQKIMDRDKRILTLLDKYPSAVSDQKDFFSKKDGCVDSIKLLKDEIKQLNESYKNEVESRRLFKQEYEQWRNLKINRLNELNRFEVEKSCYSEAFLNEVKKSKEESTKDSSQTLWNRWISLEQEIVSLREEIIQGAKSLFTGKECLSTEDTLGLGYQTALEMASFDGWRNIVNLLRARFNSEGSDSLEQIMRTFSNRLYSYFNNASRDYDVILAMFGEVKKIRNSAVKFLNECNHTDCFSDVFIDIVEDQGTPLGLFEKMRNFFSENSMYLDRDGLFSSDNVNREAIALLKQFGDGVVKFYEENGKMDWTYERMFKVYFDYKENGIQKHVEMIRDGESNSTGNLLKSFINISFVRAFYTPSGETKCILPADEINTMTPSNVPVLMDFAERAGFYLVATGQEPPLRSMFTNTIRTKKRRGSDGVWYRCAVDFSDFYKQAKEEVRDEA